MKLLVTGGNGALATALKTHLPDATYLGRDELDVCDEASVRRALLHHRPTEVLHAAAITDHQCTDIPALIATNVVGTQYVARYAGQLGIRLTYLSTHYVYPGETGGYREDDECKPIGGYAWSKYAGELAVRAKGPAHLIIRGSWYTEAKVRLWSERTLSDAYTNREPVAEAAAKVARLIKSGDIGTYNIGGPRKTFCELVMDEGYSPTPVTRPERRKWAGFIPYDFPADSSVDTTKYRLRFVA
jgi:dTDP-4-dehydrorhamnose reductase